MNGEVVSEIHGKSAKSSACPLFLQRKCEEIGALKSNHYSFRITDDLISRFSFGATFDYLEIKEKEFWKNELPTPNVRRN